MNRLNTDTIKSHSTDPTGSVAALAALGIVATLILVPVGIVKTVGALVDMASPHRAPVPQPQPQVTRAP